MQDEIARMRKAQFKNGVRVWTEDDLGRMTRLTTMDLAYLTYFPNWLMSFVLAMALAESINIIGFMLAFMTHDFSMILPFTALTMVLFGLRFPSVEAYAAEIDRVARNT